MSSLPEHVARAQRAAAEDWVSTMVRNATAAGIPFDVYWERYEDDEYAAALEIELDEARRKRFATGGPVRSDSGHVWGRHDTYLCNEADGPHYPTVFDGASALGAALAKAMPVKCPDCGGLYDPDCPTGVANSGIVHTSTDCQGFLADLDAYGIAWFGEAAEEVAS